MKKATDCRKTVTDTLYSQLKDYVRKLSDSDLSDLHKWYSENFPGDRSKIADVFSTDKDIDRWLSTATSANEWFDMLDLAQEFVEREHQWRSSERIDRISGGKRRKERV